MFSGEERDQHTIKRRVHLSCQKNQPIRKNLERKAPSNWKRCKRHLTTTIT